MRSDFLPFLSSAGLRLDFARWTVTVRQGLSSQLGRECPGKFKKIQKKLTALFAGSAQPLFSLFGGGTDEDRQIAAEQASFSNLFAPVMGDADGKWGVSSAAVSPEGRNEMFFTVGDTGKPMVERRFVLASDRRAAAKQRKQVPRQAVVEYVPLAEGLLRLQQQQRPESENAGMPSDQVMSFAPFREKVTQSPTQSARAKGRRVTAADDDEDDDPSKRYRSTAANRAATEGGAAGVPMIPKMALTRPEEFDFATAARELAKEGHEFIGQRLDVFEQAEADVRGTSNKIGMFVDLDTGLDQETVVAKRATTGKKRNPGKSRLAGLLLDAQLAQPDFGGDDVEPQPAKRSRPEPAALTVPKTPKFATAARAQSKVRRSSVSPRQKVVRAPSILSDPQQSTREVVAMRLTVPKTPSFATSARVRPSIREIVPGKKPEKRNVTQAELTQPQPFQFATNMRFGERAERAMEENYRSDFNSRRQEKIVKPAPRVALTEVREFVLNSDVRAVRRKEFEEAEKLRRAEEAAVVAEGERMRKQQEEYELKMLRRELGHKARPIVYHDVNPVPQKRSAIPLTVPFSPKFATSKRFNRP